jgi:hypothetical protein
MKHVNVSSIVFELEFFTSGEYFKDNKVNCYNTIYSNHIISEKYKILNVQV